jgi:hypothetical protein
MHTLTTGAAPLCHTSCAPVQVIAQVTGSSPLPWEHPDTAPAYLRQLKVLRRSVLACLARDPAARPSADDLLGAWLNVFDATTVAPGGADFPSRSSQQPSASASGERSVGTNLAHSVSNSGTVAAAATESTTVGLGQTFAAYERGIEES